MDLGRIQGNPALMMGRREDNIPEGGVPGDAINPQMQASA